jgi:hypothetical protein
MSHGAQPPRSILDPEDCDSARLRRLRGGGKLRLRCLVKDRVVEVHNVHGLYACTPEHLLAKSANLTLCVIP